MNLNQIENTLRAKTQQLQNNPGMAIVLAAVVLVIGVIFIYEINRSLTVDERVLVALDEAERVSDFDDLLKQHRGGKHEPLILLEKILFLANGDEDRDPDFAAAKNVLDEIYQNGNPDLIISDMVSVYAAMMAKPVNDNFKFERDYAAAKKNAPSPTPDDNETEQPDESNGSSDDDSTE